jgi:hypothetical protein
MSVFIQTYYGDARRCQRCTGEMGVSSRATTLYSEYMIPLTCTVAERDGDSVQEQRRERAPNYLHVPPRYTPRLLLARP